MSVKYLSGVQLPFQTIFLTISTGRQQFLSTSPEAAQPDRQFWGQSGLLLGLHDTLMSSTSMPGIEA